LGVNYYKELIIMENKELKGKRDRIKLFEEFIWFNRRVITEIFIVCDKEINIINEQ
jgi:hypothetical protein